MLETPFSHLPAVVGMIHVDPLPGTPRHRSAPQAIIDKAVDEALCYERSGIDGIAIENMHDIPYLRGGVGPEVTAAMTAVACAVRQAVKVPCGIQILAGANREALAVALAAGLQFTRVEGFVFAHVADEGIIESCAGALLRYRKAIGAEHIAVYCDVKKKHCSHAVTADVSLAETAKAAEFFLADGVIVTGRATGEPADLDAVREVRQATALPVLVGSGVTIDNVADYLAVADVLIIGSWFKSDGRWQAPVDEQRVRSLMQRVAELREQAS